MRKNPSIKLTARYVLLGLVLLSAAALSVSCSDDDKVTLRDEYIKVYPNPFKEETVTSLVLGVSEGEQVVYVRSNIDFTAHWENSGTTQWARVIDDNGVDSRTGCRVITLSVDRVSTSSFLYTKRTGMLVFTPTDLSLNYNVFLTCTQGSEARISDDFSWLSYGTTDPNSTGETMMEDWTTAQKNYNYTSTEVTSVGHTCCYGRRGYIQLGDDEGHGGDLITPNTSDLYQDSLLVVSFRAVAYVDPSTGQRDNNRLTIEITGGGTIQDYAESNGTSISFNVPYYDPDNPDTMWDDTNYLVFVKGTEGNPIAAGTHIRFISGSLTGTSNENSRIFLDDLYVYTVGEGEEDYFLENGGSGLDYILGDYEVY